MAKREGSDRGCEVVTGGVTVNRVAQDSSATSSHRVPLSSIASSAFGMRTASVANALPDGLLPAVGSAFRVAEPFEHR
jgi:hypothetical protein